jgi:hypothetical protein
MDYAQGNKVILARAMKDTEEAYSWDPKRLGFLPEQQAAASRMRTKLLMIVQPLIRGLAEVLV